MTIARNPTWVDTLTYASLDVRLADQLLAQSDGTAGGAQPGIRPGDTGLAVSLASTTITVAAGVALIFKTAQGVYRASNPTAWTGTLAAADPTNPRIDLVYLRVWDNSVDGAGLAKADVVYLVGTPASTPVQPSPGATEVNIPLAKITVPASGGGSASVTDLRPCYVAPGGIGIGSNIVGAYQGQYKDDGAVQGTLSRWNGTIWEVIMRRVASGELSSPAGWESARTATTDIAFSIILTGDGFDRWRAYGDGKMEWGPGSAARDTNLYRSGVGALKTDGSLTAGGALSGSNLGATTTYTPTITGPLTLGNGSITGTYTRIGSSTAINIKLVAGTTTTLAASGTLTFSLPAGITHNGADTTGTGYFTTSSGGAFNLAAAYVASTKTAVTVFLVGSSNTYGAFNTGTGAAVANGSQISLSFVVQS